MRKIYIIAVPRSVRLWIEDAKVQFKKLNEVWKVTPPDCQSQLLFEFLTNPGAFEERHAREILYRTEMASKWQ